MYFILQSINIEGVVRIVSRETIRTTPSNKKYASKMCGVWYLCYSNDICIPRPKIRLIVWRGWYLGFVNSETNTQAGSAMWQVSAQGHCFIIDVRICPAESCDRYLHKVKLFYTDIKICPAELRSMVLCKIHEITYWCQWLVSGGNVYWYQHEINVFAADSNNQASRAV